MATQLECDDRQSTYKQKSHFTQAIHSISHPSERILMSDIGEPSFPLKTTACSESMTRDDTNDVLSYGVDIMQVDSQSSPDFFSSSPAETAGPDRGHLFPLHSSAEYQHFPLCTVGSFSYSPGMKHTLVQDVKTSSPSVVSEFSSFSQQSDLYAVQTLSALGPSS